MKKSLQEAMQYAEKHSKEFPDITCYVIDKPRCKAKVYTVGWLAMRAIHYDGYYPVASFKNGKRIFE